MAGAVGLTFMGFEAAARASGFDEVLVREWDPGLVLGNHGHPFAVKGLVVRGEFWLTEGDRVRHLVEGEGFELARRDARRTLRRGGRDGVGRAPSRRLKLSAGFRLARARTTGA